MKAQIIKFSIIIPVYNGETYILDCIESILNQITHQANIEILVIDDCSTDNTYGVVEKLILKYKQIKLFTTNTNSGPGIARNIGIDNASGNWLMFVDSDDSLSKGAFSRLHEFILNNDKELDVIAYDFDFDKNSSIKKKIAGRTDILSFSKNKNELLLDYLSLYMDGSVIYTLISMELIKNNNIRFNKGLHEDVDFIFKVYAVANNISILKYPIYIKNNREGSIVNTISSVHINGFFRAYHEIYNYLQNNNLINKETLDAFYKGIIGVCATRVRAIHTQKQNNSKALYIQVYKEIQNILTLLPKNFKILTLKTKYYMIYDFLNMHISENRSNLVEELSLFMDDIALKSWSCYDLQHSLFLAPNEIRTCCKRFFVDKQIKGDVVLLSNQKYSYEEFNVDNIVKEKKDLYIEINKGISDECQRCPFLEFKEWKNIDKMSIEYISFEYHSLCNMKCIYCSDTYYGGKKNRYDIISVVADLVDKEYLENCNSIVWGGGEPTLDRDFPILLQNITDSFPNIKQRLITNSTYFLEDVNRYINTDKVSIVTSIDAGSEEVFFKVRNNKHMTEIFENLVKYSSKKPENVTIKYIVLDENRDLDEIFKFVELIREYRLEKCNFQISFDFKKESVDFQSATSIIVLYGLLIKLKVRVVFLDDLLRSRLTDISNSYNLMYNYLQKIGHQDILADVNEMTMPIVIWGAGQQTKILIEQTHFFKRVKIAFIVDNTKAKIGKKYFGYNVLDPSSIKENNYRVVISATQSTPKIIEQYKLLGLNEDRIIKNLII